MPAKPLPPVRVPAELVDEMCSWWARPLEKSDVESLQSRFNIDFEKPFSLNPPPLDGWWLGEIQSEHGFKAVDSADKTWAAIQKKVLSIATPLIHGVSSLMSVPAAERTEHLETSLAVMKAALRLTGTAAQDLTCRRRKNFMSFSHASKSYLLDTPKAFSKKEVSHHLFGERFERALTKAVKRSNAFAESGMFKKKPASASQTSSSYQSRPRTSTSNAQSRRGTSSNRGNRYEVLFPILISVPPSRVGARLSLFARAWSYLFPDSWVAETISNGVELEFHAPPTQRYPLTSHPVARPETCDREVATLLEKGAVFEVEEASGGFVSSFFTVPKRDGGHRPIVNLKPLNEFVVYHHFKMENLTTVKTLVRRDDWLVKLDLKDAYLLVPMAEQFQKFLQFKWGGKIFRFTCLPFGLASAPRIFTKILKPVVAWFRKRGVRLVIYLDDWLIMHEDPTTLTSQVGLIKSVLTFLGFLINEEKSIFTPSQSIEYLGVLIDTTSLSILLPQAKVSRIQSLCDNALACSHMSLRNIAMIIGNFGFATSAVRYARSHFRQLQHFYIENVRVKALDTLVPLTESVRAELQWWRDMVASANSKCFSLDDSEINIFADASLTGWGACFDDTRTGGPWSSAESGWHINLLELRAAFLALKALVPSASDIAIRLHIDNTTAVAYINKEGGTHSKALNNQAVELLSWCEARRIRVSAVHVPGVTNTIADAESRQVSDSSDWRLAPWAFELVREKWPVDTDLFASSWNWQLPRFVSWRPQPDAFACNAFSLSWRDCLGYAFPPFSLIAICLEKVRRERCNLVLITPLWPSQPWFPLALDLCRDAVLLLPQDPEILLSPTDQPHPLTSTRKLQLVAWSLSGDSCQSRAFRRRLSRRSSQEIELTPMPHTNQRGRTGWIGAVGATRIPCTQTSKRH